MAFALFSPISTRALSVSLKGFLAFFLIQSVNTLRFHKLRENKHTDILFEGWVSYGVLEGGQDGKRMRRRAMEPTGLPGRDEEDRPFCCSALPLSQKEVCVFAAGVSHC